VDKAINNHAATSSVIYSFLKVLQSGFNTLYYDLRIGGIKYSALMNVSRETFDLIITSESCFFGYTIKSCYIGSR